MLTRKQARENAFILIFEKSFNDISVEELLETSKSVREFETDDYVETVLSGVYDTLSDIDAIITENAKGWKIDRISRVVLSLIRLAIYEILYIPEIPVNVSVSEAVVLCKEYATDEDASYLNGILGTVARKYTKEEK